MTSAEQIKVQNAIAWAAMVRAMTDTELNAYMTALLKSGIHEAALKETLSRLPRRRVKELYALVGPVVDEMVRRLKTVSRIG